MLSYTWYQWLAFFYIYCFLGWIFESTYVSLKERRFVNRGFLRIPMLPIYGSGAVMMLWVSLPFRDSLILTFLSGVVGATALEFVTGWVMEELFKVRYWDYSDKPFNVCGYICLESSIAWGFLTILMTHLIHEPIEDAVLRMPVAWNLTFVCVVTVAFVYDGVICVREALDFGKSLEQLRKVRQDLDSLHVQTALLKMEAEERFKEAREEFREHLESQRERAAALTGQSLDNVRAAAESRLDDMRTAAEAKFGDMKSATGARLNGMKTAAGTTLGNVKAATGTTIDNVKTATGATLGNVKAATGTTLGNVKTATGTTLDGVKTAAGTTLDGVRSAAESTIGSVRNAAGAAGNKLDSFRDLTAVHLDWLRGKTPQQLEELLKDREEKRAALRRERLAFRRSRLRNNPTAVSHRYEREFKEFKDFIERDGKGQNPL